MAAAAPMQLSREPAGFAVEAPFGGQANAYEQGQAEDAFEAQSADYDYEDGEDYEDEEPPRRTRYGLIAASMVAALAVGGGLAYGYSIYKPMQAASLAPIVKSSSGPVKIKPVDPGGTKFANTDSKMMDSLSGSSDGGPRAVPTMTIGRDGTVMTGSTQAPPPTPPAPSGGVPGMILVGAQQPAQGQAATSIAQSAPATRPIVIAAASPPQAAAPSADDVSPAPVSAPPAKKLVKKPLAAVAAAGPTGANGYVAVLASLPATATSRAQAMQQFADLQQKFTGVLGNKAPDVMEAKVADKGTYHRLVVGPPASRDAAKTVCDQLKSSGYTADCWVTAF